MYKCERNQKSLKFKIDRLENMSIVKSKNLFIFFSTYKPTKNYSAVNI